MSDDVPLRCCTKCGEEFPATTEFFYSQLNGKYGLKAECRACSDKRNKSYVKNFYNRNKSEVCERLKVYRQTPEGRKYQKAYYQRPEVRERQKARKDLPGMQERWRSVAASRQARKKAISGDYTPAQIQDLLKRQKHLCYYCSTRFKRVKGKYIYHIDHTFPLSRVAGTDIPANDISYLVLTCPTCNLKKGDKYPWEWHEGGRLL